MTDYIELSAAIEATKHAWAKGLEPSQYIEALPVADVAPVVRCKDCKYRYSDSWCEYVDDDDNFYCARGERKEGADNEP